MLIPYKRLINHIHRKFFMKIEDILSKKEKIKKDFGHGTIITNKRLIINKPNHLKDIKIDAIESIEYTKTRHIKIIEAAIITFLLSALIEMIYYLLVKEFIFIIFLGTIATIILGTSYYLIYEQKIIIYGSNSNIELEKTDPEIIRYLRRT